MQFPGPPPAVSTLGPYGPNLGPPVSAPATAPVVPAPAPPPVPPPPQAQKPGIPQQQPTPVLQTTPVHQQPLVRQLYPTRRQLIYDVSYKTKPVACNCAQTVLDKELLFHQFKLVKNAIAPIMKSPTFMSAAKNNKDIEFLKTFMKGDFFRSIDVAIAEKEFSQKHPVKVTAPGGIKTFDFKLVGGTDGDRLLSALEKLGQVWEYEATQWKRLFGEVPSRHLDTRFIEDIIAEQALVLEEPFSGVQALLTIIRDHVLAQPTVDVRLENYVTKALSILRQERKLAVQKLTEGAILKNDYKRR